MEKKVSIVIPNYNGQRLLAENLPKVIEAAIGVEEVLVVDDASTDDSIAVLRSLKKQFNNLTIVKKAINEGFSSTINLGVKKAKGDLVVLLNSDVIPQKNFLKLVLPHFENEKLFAVGLHDHSFEKSGEIISRGRGVGNFIRGYLMHRPGKIKSAISLWASCGSGVFRKNYWEKLGGLLTAYNPAYGEDWDLGYRAWKSGYEIIFEPKAFVEHHHEEGALKKRYSAFYRRAITFRNQNIFMIVNITDLKLLFWYLLFLPYHLIYKFDFSFWYGFLLYIFKLPESFKLRDNNRRLFVKSDREIVNGFSSEFKAKNEELF